MPTFANRSGSSKLFKHISEAICSGKLQAGEKLRPITDLAREYGVSYGTARSSLVRLEKEGLVNKRHGSGTYVAPRPARTLLRNLVYLFLFSKSHLYDHLTADLLEYLHKSELMGVQVGWKGLRGPEQAGYLLDRWRDETPKAVVTQFPDFLCPGINEVIDQVRRDETRVIATFLDPQSLPAGWHCVNPNWDQVFQLAVGHLLKQGCDRLGMILDGQPPSDSRPDTDKATVGITRRSMERAMSELGGKDELIIHKNLPTGMWCDAFDGGNLLRVAEWLSGLDLPIGIVAQDSRISAVIRVAKQLGLNVPGDLMVVGVGNTPWAEAGNFTSVSVEPHDIAAHIARLINSTEDEPRGQSSVLIPPKLVIRENGIQHESHSISMGNREEVYQAST